MPSIVERVSEAEAQALTRKKEATRQAREIEAAARQAAQGRLEAAREEGRRLIAESSAEAEAAGKQLAIDIWEKRAAESAARCEQARQALPQAAAYILERVKA